MAYPITFYKGSDGSRPVVDWLEVLRKSEPILEKLVVSGLEKLRKSERYGPPLTKGIDDTNGLFELRVGKTNTARVFFFFQSSQEIVVTNGYVKKRQKLDQGEL